MALSHTPSRQGYARLDRRLPCSAAFTRSFQYEEASLAGRQRGITEQGKISERFVWSVNFAEEQSHNLSGQLVSPFDPTSFVSLSGVTHQLLPDDALADW
ncbi:hypothetical protein [Kosakonia pseudosacchari]|uniref:hypothetical protein n=1 Tax=Kosakonia pseudosacchari TaxID=1646340 RepID=UPI000A3D33C6|nr:hypothetical protein [Kosakonia pseudosacchari]